MADPITSARAKLKRANLYAGIAQREASRFFDKQPGPSIAVKAKADLGVVDVGETVDLDIVVTEGMPELPDSFSPRFGDAIHNYRCALDHIAWQLVKHGTSPNADPFLVQFPIYPKHRKFRDELATRLPGVDTRGGGPCDFIERRHRYKAGKARNLTLLRLAKLDNDDKHRNLHAMVAAVAKANHEVTFVRCVPVEFRDPPTPPELKPDAVIAHLSVGSPESLTPAWMWYPNSPVT